MTAASCMEFTLEFICAALIFTRVIDIVGSDHRAFMRRHPVRALLFSLHVALCAGGTLLVLFDMRYGGEMLLVSLSLLVIADKRYPFSRKAQHQPERRIQRDGEWV